MQLYSSSTENDFSLLHVSDAFSLLLSSFAIRDPNCTALFGKMAEAVRPNSLAARRRSNFSPIPRGKVKSAFSKMGRELRNETTSSSRKGNLKERYTWGKTF